MTNNSMYNWWSN